MRVVHVGHAVIVGDMPPEDEAPRIDLGEPCPLDGYDRPHDCDACVVVLIDHLHYTFTCQSQVREFEELPDRPTEIVSPLPALFVSYRTRSRVEDARLCYRNIHQNGIAERPIPTSTAVSHDPGLEFGACGCYSCVQRYTGDF